MVEYSLTILVAIAFQVIIGTFAKPGNYHLTEEQATHIKNYLTVWKEVLNFEKNQCEEFYEFVCSKNAYPNIPNGKSANEFITEFFNDNPKMLTETEKKFMNFSTMCAKPTSEEKKEFIREYQFKSIEKWPAFSGTWGANEFDWPLAIAEVSSFVRMGVVFQQDFDFDLQISNNSYYKIGRNTLLNMTKVEKLLKLKFEELGIKNPEEIIADAAVFIKTFNEAADSIKSTFDIKTKFSELKRLLPEIDWYKQVEIIYGVGCPDDYPVVVRSFQKLKKICTAISTLNPKVIANYLFCAFVYNINEIDFMKRQTYFMPVFKGALMKYLYKNKKDMLKGMYMHALDTFREVDGIKTLYTTEEMAKFLNEDVFGPVDEEALAKEYKDITISDKECLKTYLQLQKLYNRRLANRHLNNINDFISAIEDKITDDLVGSIPKLIEYPSTAIFKPIVFMAFSYVFDRFNKSHGHYSDAQKECFSKQFTDEITQNDLEIMRGTQFVLKVFLEWAKNYADVLQEENRIFKESGLAVQQLGVISPFKLMCNNVKSFNAIMIALAKSDGFQKIYDCPVGSKLNAHGKCNLLS